MDMVWLHGERPQGRGGEVSNIVVEVDSMEKVIKHWPFLEQGRLALNNPMGAGCTIDYEYFTQILFDNINRKRGYGVTAILTSKNGSYLGYFIARMNYEPGCPPGLVVHFGYCNGKCKTTSRELLVYCEKWAKRHKYVELIACTRRFSGASLRLFERKWGFQRDLIVFRKPL